MSLKSRFINSLKRVLGVSVVLSEIKRLHEDAALRSGYLLETAFSNKSEIQTFEDIEFKVFSQWGDDGIIAWLTRQLQLENPFFIEFGVQNYEESNTRFLLQRQNWSGLIIDGNKQYIESILSDPICWKYDLAVKNLFITKDNIDAFLMENCPKQDIDLLSIDIDGNDYWILQAIKSVKPRILICEYNSLFGSEHAVTVPYQENFFRGLAHYSNLYFGASIQALIQLAQEKGYTFLGTNSNGNNAYFIRNDLSAAVAGKIKTKKIFNAKFRESRDARGRLSMLNPKDALREIKDMKVLMLKNTQLVRIQDLFHLDKNG